VLSTKPLAIACSTIASKMSWATFMSLKRRRQFWLSVEASNTASVSCKPKNQR
jgi:hypothetical protein